jgi:hypothetical protein
MSRRRNRIEGQFSAKLIEMLESPAWRSLSLSAHRVLDRVEIELAHHGGTGNGTLPVTFDQFVAYGIHRHAVAPAIREATALGFLQVTQRGRAGNAEHRAPNQFRLTYKPAKGHDGHGTNEWRSIKGTEQAEALARAARAPVKKTKLQCRKTPNFSDGNRHRKRKSPVPVSVTTGMVRKPSLLSISRCGSGHSPPPSPIPAVPDAVQRRTWPGRNLHHSVPSSGQRPSTCEEVTP